MHTSQPIIRFDLSAIPTNSLIASATLQLDNNTPGVCSIPQLAQH